MSNPGPNPPHCWHYAGESTQYDLYKELVQVCCWCGTRRVYRCNFGLGPPRHGPYADPPADPCMFLEPYGVYPDSVNPHSCPGHAR